MLRFPELAAIVKREGLHPPLTTGIQGNRLIEDQARGKVEGERLAARRCLGGPTLLATLAILAHQSLAVVPDNMLRVHRQCQRHDPSGVAPEQVSGCGIECPHFPWLTIPEELFGNTALVAYPQLRRITFEFACAMIYEA